ncbi:hypothetical protein J4E85_000227 [Alternaria conjuncta]|uniref:uncharacterized protein n=1 Tax=Alternaria conjuncta TaxID=181017 RepID=UPI00221F616D|nr:uncharacterized protein J4E85_000227 [Alternaria conjuncta]KAI4937791.1 hypothetical protein J4E85_000227 [Alternaria conjuncta]
MATPTTNSTTVPATATATTFNFLRRIRTRVVDFLLPENIRQEYRRIIAPLARYRYAFVALVASTLFAIAEYEQPVYFPRPQELTNAVIGFLCASMLIFAAFALMEYTETHTWPWEDEGFVWPWQALLWSQTAYVDETMGESVAAYRNMNMMAPSIRVDGGAEAVVLEETASWNDSTRSIADSTLGSTTPAARPLDPTSSSRLRPCYLVAFDPSIFHHRRSIILVSWGSRRRRSSSNTSAGT